MSDLALTQSNRASAIKGRPFRLLLAGSSVSVLGTRMSTIAFPMLVLWLTGSPVAAGWTAFAATAPSMLVYMPAGALVDRWPPRRVMLISEFGRGVAIATVSLALLLGWANLSLLIGAAVIEEILEVFSTLAERRYVSSLVGHELASSALVRMEARTHVMVLAGRPLGGFLFAVMPTLPFIADTLSFVISVTALIRIKSGQVIELATLLRTRIRSSPPAKPTSSREPDHATVNYRHPVSWAQLWSDMRDGWHWLHHDQFTRVTVLLSAGTTLICQALIMVFLAYAHGQHLSSVMIGMALAASGLGGALGSILASRLPAPTRRSWTVIRILAWSASVVVLVISAGRSFACLALVMAALGFTGALGNVELGTYLIHNAPDEMLARVTSIGRLLSFGACALGPVLGGVLIQEYKIQDTALLLGVAIFLLSVTSLFLPSARTRKSRMIKIMEVAITCVISSSYAFSRGWVVLKGLATHAVVQGDGNHLPGNSANTFPWYQLQDAALRGLGTADHVTGNGSPGAAVHYLRPQLPSAAYPGPAQYGLDHAAPGVGGRREHRLSRWHAWRGRSREYQRDLHDSAAEPVASSHPLDAPGRVAQKISPTSHQEGQGRALDAPSPAPAPAY